MDGRWLRGRPSGLQSVSASAPCWVCSRGRGPALFWWITTPNMDLREPGCAGAVNGPGTCAAMARLLPLWPFIGLLGGVVLVGIDPWIPNRRGRVFESRLASAPGDPVSLNAGLLARHALGSGIALALIAGLWLGGAELIKHLVLRLAATWGTPLPLRLAGFLERVCDLGLMQRVGDGYRFTHRLLGQHIAARWRPRD